MSLISEIVYSIKSDLKIKSTTDFKTHLPQIESINVKREDQTITVKVKNVYAEDGIEEITQIIRTYLSLLCIKYDVRLYRLENLASSLPYKAVEKQGLYAVQKCLEIQTSIETYKHEVSNIELSNIFSFDLNQYDSRIIRELAVALSTEDPVVKFILLYRVLQEYLGDNQRIVDKEIKKIFPQVELSISPRNENVTETIYSRLRNELSHKRKGELSDIEKTKREIISNIEKFICIVKQIIFPSAQKSH